MKDVLIFILDDDETEAEQIGLLLKENGFTNYKIFTVSEHLLLNMDHGARIFIIDYKLDKMNGLEVIEKIKAQMPHCYFIMLSGMRSYAVVEQFCNAVIRGRYVTKGEADSNNKVIQFVNEFIEDMRMMETFYKSQAELMNSVNEIRKMIKKDK